jgi:hypothetical protein
MMKMMSLMTMEMMMTMVLDKNNNKEFNNIFYKFFR